MPFVLYNTYARREETFTPSEGKLVKMYTCGPTVYGRPHIGNYSSFLMADLLRRWLEVSGYEVRHVKNITDVGHLVADQDEGEDKIQKQAKAENTDPLAIARKYTAMYLADEAALNMLEPYARPLATETITEMVEIIKILIDRGHAYETADGVYFDVRTFPRYGMLSGNTLENLDAGARVAVDEQKKHPADFALWKKTVGANAHHLLKWPSPWGDGFPGWHIECSAMSKKHLGEQLDIHTGGEDNIFPHHECEIAQSECSGPAPFSRYWLHKRRIELAGDDGELVKMSKSLGNVYTIPDIIEAGFSPLDLRYLFLSVHYRTRLKFSWKGLDDARKARRKVLEWMAEVEEGRGGGTEASTADGVAAWHGQFRAAMDSDLNTSGALAAVFECMTWSRRFAWKGEAKDALLAFIRDVRHTFGCFEPEKAAALPADVQKLLDQRKEARAQKDFAASDALRAQLQVLGYDVKDTAQGQETRPL
jgi:cysteinyl-tRNA synthetase